MSTHGQQVTIDPLGRGPHEGTVVGTVPRSDGPRRDLRVRIDSTTWRVRPEDLSDGP